MLGRCMGHDEVMDIARVYCAICKDNHTLCVDCFLKGHTVIGSAKRRRETKANSSGYTNESTKPSPQPPVTSVATDSSTGSPASGLLL